VFVHHFGEASFGKLVPTGEYTAVLRENQQRFAEKWGCAWQPYERRASAEYGQQVGRVRQIACRLLPPDATVAVVSRGDEQLLDLNGRRARHFPRMADGIYAGQYPADSAEAISQVDAVRAAGADYLLFPATAFWWLDHYPGLREHLERHHRMVVRQQHVCLIYALQDRPTPGPCGNHAAPAR
jgi:hypothetical protein